MANLYYNRIVQLNVSETVAPTPNRLQGTAAIVSMGGTTIPAGTTQLISSSSDLANYLIPAYDIASLAWSAGVVTLVTTNPHGIPVGSTTTIVVAGVSTTAYNGTFTATGVDATTLHYSLADPTVHSITGSGTVEVGPQVFLQAADDTWWAQGNTFTGYYIYETGTAVVANVITSVQTYLTANPQTIYNWIFLPGVDSDHTDVKAFLLLHNALTSLIKFYLPVSVSTYTSWDTENTLRNTFIMIQSPDANASTELDVVSFAQYMTSFTPSPTNKLPPSQYTYLDAVTAYAPLTQSTINAFLAGNVNFVATGAEGGISNTILVAGKNLNGTPANVGFSIDWQQIQLNEAISNAVINGSNNPEAPLYYNQDGINFLQQVAATVATRAIQSGLALGQVVLTQLDAVTFASNVQKGLYAGNYVINAVPFTDYVAVNPSDYANQIYGGFSASYVPQYGFETIVFNLNVTQFA
jgi:hypothetical protein